MSNEYTEPFQIRTREVTIIYGAVKLCEDVGDVGKMFIFIFISLHRLVSDEDNKFMCTQLNHAV
jgi:hypothetical protein